MGCSNSREKIEDQMMQIKLKRMEIQMERQNRIKELSEMEGRKICYKDIPDYIDPRFAKEKNIIYDIDFNCKLTKDILEKNKNIKIRQNIRRKNKEKTKN